MSEPASQRTPGGSRRRGGPKQHVPFQHELDRGKRTGAKLRDAYRRNSDGVEEFGQYFSPASVAGKSAVGASATSIRKTTTTANAARNAAANEAANDENSDEVSMDLDDSVIAAPNEYFTSQSRPQAPSDHARGVPRTSDVDYDRIPSPGSSTLTRGARRKSAPNATGQSTADEGQTMRSRSSLGTSRVLQAATPDGSAKSRRTNTIIPRDQVGEDSGGPDELEDVPDPSPSIRAGRGRKTVSSPAPPPPDNVDELVDEAAEDEDELEATPRPKGRGKGKERQVEPATPEPEEQDDEDEPLVNGDYEEAFEGEEQDEEEGDEEPVDENEEQNEEQPEEEEKPKRRGPARKAAQKAAPKSKPKATRAKRGAKAEPERQGSQLLEFDDDGETGHYFDEEGRRRHTRHRYPPLAYWRNEKVIFGRPQSGTAPVPVVKGLVKVRTPSPQLKKKSYNHKRKRADDDDEPRRTKRRRADDDEDEDEDPPERGWDEKTDPLGVVLEYVTKQEIERRIAFTESMIQPRQALNAKFSFQKVFGDGEFLAAGMLTIPQGGAKGSKSSKDNSYVFFVIRGAVKVQVYRTTFLIAQGGMFLVPRGNLYSIENVAERETVLFFAQARKIPEDMSVNIEEEGSQDAEMTPSSARRHHSATPGPSGGSRGSERRSMPPSMTRRLEDSPREAGPSGSRALSERPTAARATPLSARLNGVNGKRKAR